MKGKIAVLGVLVALSALLISGGIVLGAGRPVRRSPAGALWTETFDGPQLASGWMWMREDRGNWSLSATHGQLRITTQPQQLYSGAPNSQENILLRPAPSGDYTLTTRVTFAPTADFQQAALFVYRNDDNFVLMNRGYCAHCVTGGHGLYFDSEHEGTADFLVNTAYSGATVSLRIARSGATYSASYSADGVEWCMLGQVVRPDLAGALVGVSATNANTEPSALSTHADYEFLTIETSTWSAYLPVVRGTQARPRPVIVDDDGSPDGVIALLYLLRHPGVDVKAITVSNGEAHTEVFAQNLTRMLARLGRSGIPVAAGRSSPLEGSNTFPDPWRQGSDAFWGIQLPASGEPVQSVSAAELIVQVVNSSEEPVVVLVLGTHTNLAEALRIDPTIGSRIRLVQIMGGAAYVAGNIHSDWPAFDNEVAEWNIWVDPVAANEVLTAGLPLRLVPLDATNQVLWTEEDAAAWENSHTSEGAVAADLLRAMLSWWAPEGVYVWDTVAAVDLTDPGLCYSDDLHLEVVTQAGSQQGRTVPSTIQPANAAVCLIPDVDAIRARVTHILAAPE